ncbi:hypothetical protein OHB56_12085 [Streptomyces sp. NBC_01635]|uniref:hypothetical protein n=1 Tax=Streptomyces sp. NBC_01635 TaxID=2975904 RepID=UPI00386B4EC4|nr:hypothetical protein OHB56_12085 [Streptomyces sp. NBC_01635]
MKVEITACDIDRRTPAKSYEITVDGGRTVTLSLCRAHAAPLEGLIEIATKGQDAASAASAGVRTGAEQAGAVTLPVSPSASEEPARKPSARRRARVTTLEEIEAMKKMT